MRFVDPKSAEQQSRAILLRARERLVHQRTELVNALRACLYEYGHVVPQGIQQITRIAEILNAPNNDLPDLMRVECRDLLEIGRAQSELQSLMRISYAVFCLKKKTTRNYQHSNTLSRSINITITSLNLQ